MQPWPWREGGREGGRSAAIVRQAVFAKMRSPSPFTMMQLAPVLRRSFAHTKTTSTGPEPIEVARFEHPVTGVAATPDGRVFVTQPRLFTKPTDAVLEVLPDGGHRPYPDRRWNRWDGRAGASAKRAWVSPQAIELDPAQSLLWVLDPGKGGLVRGVVEGGAKLVAVELATDRVRRVIDFDRRAAPRRSYLNDVRIDPVREVAYITDSGRGGLLVVELATGRCARRLADHPSTHAEPGYTPRVGGRRWTTFFGITPRVHADGIELSADREWLYYHALTATTLYRVPTRSLRDPSITEAALGEAVEALGRTGAVDGMRLARDGALYLTALEQDAIVRRSPDGDAEVVVRDSKIRWPDTIAVVVDATGRRTMYFTVSQIHQAWPFNWGRNAMSDPPRLFRVSLPA